MIVMMMMMMMMMMNGDEGWCMINGVWMHNGGCIMVN